MNWTVHAARAAARSCSALALAGGGGFTVDAVSMHARTNAEVIALFLPARFSFGKHDGLDCCTVEPR